MINVCSWQCFSGWCVVLFWFFFLTGEMEPSPILKSKTQVTTMTFMAGRSLLLWQSWCSITWSIMGSWKRKMVTSLNSSIPSIVQIPLQRGEWLQYMLSLDSPHIFLGAYVILQFCQKVDWLAMKKLFAPMICNLLMICNLIVVKMPFLYSRDLLVCNTLQFLRVGSVLTLIDKKINECILKSIIIHYYVNYWLLHK